MFTAIDPIRGLPVTIADHESANEDFYNEQSGAENAARYGADVSSQNYVEFYKFRAHHSSIRDIQVSDNAIFTASDDRTVKIWSNEDFSLMKTLKGHSHIVSNIALSQDANHMLTSSYDRTIRLWDLQKFESPRVFRGHENAVLSVAVSKDNRVIVSGGADNKVLMWNAKGTIKSESKVHTGFVNYLQFNPGFSDICYSCSEDGTVLAYNLQDMTMKPYATITGNNSPIICLDSSPDSSLVATITHNEVFFYEGCMGEYIAAYKLPSKEMNRKRKLVNVSGSCVKFNPREVWIGYSFGHNLQIHYLSESKLAASFSIANEADFPSAKFTKFTWSNDGRSLFAAATDGFVRIYRFPENN